jgi:DNA-binding MarR family transcriptional regulator
MAERDEVADTATKVYLAATRLAQRIRAERPRDGTTLSMLSVLSHLRREGPMTAGRLAALRRLEPQTLTRTLHQLEAEGLIRRGPAANDRRQAWIEISEQGLARLRDDMQPRVAWLARAMLPLSATEQGVLRLAAALMEELAQWEPSGEAQEPAVLGPDDTEDGSDG